MQDEFKYNDILEEFQLLDTMSVSVFSIVTLKDPRSAARLLCFLTLVLGMAVGVIHCAGWSLVFPSIVEGRMWRVASVMMLAIPTLWSLVFSVFFLIWPLSWNSHDKKYYASQRVNYYVEAFTFITGTIYYYARLFIMLEVFLALRKLPISATYTVQWTTFIPHV